MASCREKAGQGKQHLRKEATACCTQGGLGWTLGWLGVLRVRVHCCDRWFENSLAAQRVGKRELSQLPA